MNEMTMQPSPDTSVIQDLLKGAGAFIMGALGAVAVFGARLKINETKLADRDKAMDEKLAAHRADVARDIEAQRSAVTSSHNTLTTKMLEVEREFRDEIASLRQENRTRHEENKGRARMLDRRALFTLKLVADVARKIGVDNRVDDAVIGFLTEGDDDIGRDS
jgi:hypothetical protein